MNEALEKILQEIQDEAAHALGTEADVQLEVMTENLQAIMKLVNDALKINQKEE